MPEKSSRETQRSLLNNKCNNNGDEREQQRDQRARGRLRAARGSTTRSLCPGHTAQDRLKSNSQWGGFDCVLR